MPPLQPLSNTERLEQNAVRLNWLGMILIAAAVLGGLAGLAEYWPVAIGGLLATLAIAFFMFTTAGLIRLFIGMAADVRRSADANEKSAAAAERSAAALERLKRPSGSGS